MADAKQCDRCAAYYTPPLDISFFRYSVFRNSVEVDLCPKCKDRLKAFIDAGKKETE